MYGNLHYIKKTSSIIYSHYDNGNKGIEEGKKQIVKEHFVPSFYIVDEKSTGKYKTGEGEPLTEIICDTWKKRQSKIDYYKSSGRKIYGSDYKTENLFISQKYPYNIEQHVPKINGIFIDIETECEEGFPNPHIAYERINLITIYDFNSSLFYTLALPYNEKDRGIYKNIHEDVIYKEFTEEIDLLKEFIKIMRKLDPDVISGWNSSGFDIPFIYNRIEKIVGEGAIKKIAPFGSANKREVNKKNNWGQMETTFDYSIKGITDLDYLVIYKKYEQNKKDSYKLDDVCEMEIGANKKHHPNDCSFRDFYRKHWVEFVDYNIQDVRLLKKLDDKKGYINLSYTLAYTCKCTFPDNIGTVTKQESAIYNILKNDNNVITPDDWNREERISTKFEQYAGAFVKEPNPGIYKYIIDLDIASLYPSIMRMLNLSPETKLFQIESYVENKDGSLSNDVRLLVDMNEDEEITLIYPNGNTEDKLVGDVRKDILANKWHISSNNTVFEYKGNKAGVIPSILTKWYASRKANKKLSFNHEERAIEIATNGFVVDNELFSELID